MSGGESAALPHRQLTAVSSGEDAKLSTVTAR